MSLGASLVLYLLMGAGVAAAVVLSGAGRSTAERVFRVLAAVPFWPLFVPLLLTGPRSAPPAPSGAGSAPADELAAALTRAAAELQTALAGLGAGTGRAPGWEGECLRELLAAWEGQAECVRAMDRLLAQDDEPLPAGERLRDLERARRENRERLRRLRAEARDELLANLARARELASWIYLVRFSDAPAGRAGELAARLDGLVESARALGRRAAITS